MLRNFRELYNYRALLWSLTQRELNARYRGSLLGFFWTFLNPMLHMLVYMLVFGFFMKQRVPNYTYFIFVGLLPWIWFSTSIAGGVVAISSRRDLLTKVRFPAQVLPATVVASNFFNYLLSLPLMVLLGLLFGVWPTWHALLFPLIALLQFAFTLGLCYVISALNVTFRDLQHIVGNVVMLWFFVTPVLYRVETIPEQFRNWVLILNPAAALINAYQQIFYDHQLPDPKPLAWVALLSFVLLWAASQLFERRREEFAEFV